MTSILLMTVLVAAGLQQSTSLNVPGTPANAPTTITGCLMPAGGTTSMPGSGGSSGTGPAGMNADAANSGAFFVLPLGKKKKPADVTSYTLEGVDAAQLKQYGNSRVELQGVLLPPQAPAGPDLTMATAKKDGKKDKDASKPPSRFRVTAIKQVPGSCGGQ
jgi:hypothetical protein